MSDPDGLIEYDADLLGKKIKVKISDDLKSVDGKKLKGEGSDSSSGENQNQHQ